MDVLVVVDAWEDWPIEDTREFPMITKDAHAWGQWINSQLVHVRRHCDVIHYLDNADQGRMKVIDRSPDRVISKMGEWMEEVRMTGKWRDKNGLLEYKYKRIFFCGFHYGVCIENNMDQTFRHGADMFAWPQIGIVDNLTARHPKHGWNQILSKYRHYTYSYKEGFNDIGDKA